MPDRYEPTVSDQTRNLTADLVTAGSTIASPAHAGWLADLRRADVAESLLLRVLDAWLGNQPLADLVAEAQTLLADAAGSDADADLGLTGPTIAGPWSQSWPVAVRRRAAAEGYLARLAAADADGIDPGDILLEVRDYLR
jgi:hypothetical protein